MGTALSTVLPMAALVLIGYVAAWLRVIPLEGTNGIGAFVYYLAIPALIFRTIAGGSHSASLDLGIVFSYFGGAYASFALAHLFGRLILGIRADEQAILGMGAAFANTVQIGIPLIFTLYGEPGLVPMSLITSFHSLTLIPITMIAIELGRGGHSGGFRVLIAAAKALARNPLIISLVGALAWSRSGAPVPHMLDAFTGMLSGAATPCALFALGASLSAYRITADLRSSVTMTAFKLLVHPLFVFLLARYVFRLDPTWVAIGTLTAALPVGANVFIMAQRYDVLVGPTTAAIVISSLVSLITVSAIIVLIGPVR